MIAHLRRAGAVIVGKTNLHEFAMGTTSEDSAYGPARHPIDDTRSPGGSSGGSAIAVASGMSLGAVGTDTGGSIRIPSAACGLVGIKPAFGELSCDGVVPLSRSLDHVGPLARTRHGRVAALRRDGRPRRADPIRRRQRGWRESAARIRRSAEHDARRWRWPSRGARRSRAAISSSACSPTSAAASTKRWHGCAARRPDRARRAAARRGDRADLSAHLPRRGGGVSRADAGDDGRGLHAGRCGCASSGPLHPGRGLSARAGRTRSAARRRHGGARRRISCCCCRRCRSSAPPIGAATVPIGDPKSRCAPRCCA